MQVEHGISDAESEVEKEDKNTENMTKIEEVTNNGTNEPKPEGMFFIVQIFNLIY